MVELAPAQAVTRGEAPGNGQTNEEIILTREGKNGKVTAKWSIAGFGNKQKVLYSKYFEVGGYDCRLLVYPSGDAQALPGYMSLYLQISDPGSSSSKWDCFASYQLAVRNLADDSKSVRRDSWHRFSAKKRSHGWCDFAALSTLLDPKQGFLGPDGTIQVSTDITILDEAVTFTRENDLGGGAPLSSSDVYSGKFVWRVQNFSVFQPLLRTQKIMSPAFPAGECALRMSVYQSSVGGVDYLSLCLESKDTERSGSPDRTCWCLFRLAVQPQGAEGGRTVHRDSYGRFACDGRSGDNTSLGWNDFMPMADFLAPGAAYLDGDTAVFSTSFHVIREATSLVRHLEPRGATAGNALAARSRDKRKTGAARESEWAGRFQWRLEHFTRLKDLLKKRKITGLCIKSRRFTVGGRDCRLIVYPRGQSQPPTFLSVFLEVTDPTPPSPDWTCFVSHRLSVVNQRGEADRSVSKESQNRYSKSAKDWGWREFVSLTTLFDADAGFLVNDAVVFSAEVLVLKESSEVKKVPLPLPPAGEEAAAPSGDDGAAGGVATPPATPAAAPAAPAEAPHKVCFTWRIENFLAFKDVVETRKIFSRFFSAGPCDVRVGLYESFDSLCVYLESDAAAAPPVAPAAGAAGSGDGATAEKPASYWVRYRAAIMNQRFPEKTQWREGSVYTRSWNNSVLQFPRVGGSGGAAGGDAGGLLLRDSLAVSVEILECRPWNQETDGAAAPAAAAPITPTGAGQRAADAAAGTGGATGGAAAAGRVSPGDGGSTDGDEDSSSTLGSDEDDEDDLEDLEDDDPRGDAEVEDALGRWLSAAGLELLGIDNHPPLVGDIAAVQTTLGDMLASQPGAIPMFVASLRMYMSSLPRVKRLLLPCLSTVPSAPGAVYGVAPSVVSILAGLPSMRQPLINMLVDVMLDHTLTAKMHKHLLGDAVAASSAATAAAGAENGGEAGGEGAAVPPDGAAPFTPPASPAKTGSGATGAPAASPADSSRSARISGSLADAPPDEVEQTLGLILGWMRSVDPGLLPPPPGDGSAAAADAGGAHPAAPLSPLHKVSMLLADAPPALQADIVSLVPRLVGPREHTAAAGALLGRLAEASREGAETEAELRLPVLAALGALHIDPGVAQKVLQAAMEAVPSLSPSELPPAIGLVLKLASGNDAACKAAVTAVRERVQGGVGGGDAAAAAAQQSGAVDALRLAVVQHPTVAHAVLAAIKQECASKEGAAPTPLTAADVHMLLDCLALPSLRNLAIGVVKECVKADRVDIATLNACLQDRQRPATPEPTAAAVAANGHGAEDSSSDEEAEAQQKDAEGAEKQGEGAAAAVEGPATPAPTATATAGPRLTSAAQRTFVRAHPLATDPGDGPMPADIAAQLRLSFPESASPSGLPSLAASGSADELGGCLAAAEALLRVEDSRAKRLASDWILATFRCAAAAGDAAGQRRVIKALASLALTASNDAEAPSDNAAPALASSLLATLAADAPAPGGASLVLSVVMEMAAEAGRGAQAAQADAAAATARHAQELASQRTAVSKAESAARRAQEHASELESALARRTAEHAAELSGLASDRKALQAQLRAAEQQVEWVKSERDEERSARGREGREASQRLAEAEAQLTRLKATRRDEQKRAQKDRSSLADRVRELEEALERAEGETARARGDAGLAASRAEKAAAEARRRAEAAERALSQRDAEMAALRGAAAERDAHLRAAMDARRQLEQALAAERQRIAMLTGSVSLDGASPADLESLAGVHEAGLRRVNALLGHRGGSLGSLSPAGKAPAGFRGGPAAGGAAAPPPYASRSMHSLGGHGSLDSMGSLQGSEGGPGGSSGGLFGGAEWGLGAQVGRGAGGAGSGPEGAAPGQADDSATMEKLLGLLPSDLLHS